MTATVQYPVETDVFDRILEEVQRTLHTDRRLPDWPFVVSIGNADICQYSHAIDDSFSTVLQALVDSHGDESVNLVVLDPSPGYYRENYGSYPAFKALGHTIASNYWNLVAYEPDGDPTGAVTYTANTVALSGSSGCWAVWAERRWDIAIVLSQYAEGPWTSCGVCFVPATEALADFTEPDFKVPLADEERAAFLRNVRERGSGS